MQVLVRLWGQKEWKNFVKTLVVNLQILSKFYRGKWRLIAWDFFYQGRMVKGNDLIVV